MEVVIVRIDQTIWQSMWANAARRCPNEWKWNSLSDDAKIIKGVINRKKVILVKFCVDEEYTETTSTCFYKTKCIA